MLPPAMRIARRSRTLRSHLFAMALVATGCTKDVELPPTLEISTEALDFGEVSVGASAEQAFTLSNSGGGEIDVLSVQLVDGDSEAWSIVRWAEQLDGGKGGVYDDVRLRVIQWMHGQGAHSENLLARILASPNVAAGSSAPCTECSRVPSRRRSATVGGSAY